MADDSLLKRYEASKTTHDAYQAAVRAYNDYKMADMAGVSKEEKEVMHKIAVAALDVYAKAAEAARNITDKIISNDDD